MVCFSRFFWGRLPHPTPPTTPPYPSHPPARTARPRRAPPARASRHARPLLLRLVESSPPLLAQRLGAGLQLAAERLGREAARGASRAPSARGGTPLVGIRVTGHGVLIHLFEGAKERWGSNIGSADPCLICSRSFFSRGRKAPFLPVTEGICERVPGTWKINFLKTISVSCQVSGREGRTLLMNKPRHLNFLSGESFSPGPGHLIQNWGFISQESTLPK